VTVLRGPRPSSPRTAWLVLALWLGAGCASTQRPTPAAAASEHPAYPGRCQFVGLEMVESSTDRSTGDTGSVQLVATYRPGERAGDGPFTLSFHVRRERVHDLRTHLEQHPTVLCGPKPEASGTYGVELPPFEGQTGESSGH
jgi:hypothetical protein